MLFEISLLILSINAGINCPLLLTLHVVRWGGLGTTSKKTVKLVTLSKKGGRGQENGKIWNVGEKMTFS